MKLRRLSLALLFLLPSVSVLADWFPYIPRISAAGLVSNDQDILQGDAMAALFGNQQTILWGDVQGKNSLNSSWSGDLGLGYRYVYDCERVLGAYLFADTSRALDGGHHFWDLSPGIESMGQLWDFRINGYFPVSNKNPLVQENFADNFGQYQFVTFSGHNQYDRLLDLYQAVGNGVDGEVGRLIVPGLTAYVGGYYFAAAKSAHENSALNQSTFTVTSTESWPVSTSGLVNPQNVKGVSARAQYEFNSHVALEFADTYDNVLHDTVLGGIRYTLGGMNNSSQDRSDISSRLLDPVERELATQGQGTAIPVQNQLQLGSGLLLERSNIWFFEPGGTPSPYSQSGTGVVNSTSQCTFEHPCDTTDFTQSNINNIANLSPGANFYLATASYTIGDAFTLDTDQSIFGREPGFLSPAQGDDRPILFGVINLPAVSTDIFNSLQLMNDGPLTNVGLTLLGADNVAVENSVIGSTDSTSLEAYDVGIKITNNNNNLEVNDSLVNGIQSGGNFGAGLLLDGEFGISDNNNVIIQNSIITGFTGIWINGLHGEANYNSVVLSQSQINAISDGIILGGELNGNANNNALIIKNSLISNPVNDAILVSGERGKANTNSIDIENSRLFSQFYGITFSGTNDGMTDNNKVFITDSLISAQAAGILVDSTVSGDASNNNITLTNSNIIINSTTSLAKYGIWNDGEGGNATGNVYNIINSKISVTNAGNAYGVADTNPPGSNIWNYNLSDITVSSSGAQNCKVAYDFTGSSYNTCLN
jgi:hypothetical protein